MTAARVQLLFAALLLAGCVAGEPRFFDDESAAVVALRANAYAHESGEHAVVEVRGLGADALERAFSGEIRIALDRQDRSTAEHQYAPFKAWRDEVNADDFASPTVPMYVLRVAAADLTPMTTYRAWANATIGDRLLAAEPVLFEWR